MFQFFIVCFVFVLFEAFTSAMYVVCEMNAEKKVYYVTNCSVMNRSILFGSPILIRAVVNN